ncbi:MAG: EthD domain-containing protein [Candidatus Binatia bacterium]
MVRLMYCVNRREDISPEEFRRYWQDEKYASLLGKFTTIYRAARFDRNLTLNIQMNVQIMERQETGTPFDGIIEIWWDSAKELIAVNESPEAEELKRKIREYEGQFINRSLSKIFFTES